MVALCPIHHPAADAGLFSREQLRAFKQGGQSVEQVKAVFPWSQREMLVRLGGCYTSAHADVLRVGGESIVSLARDPSGLLLVSFRLCAEDGSTSLTMDENMLLGDPESFYDLEVDTGSSFIKVWFATGQIGLELAFSRVSLEELASILEADRKQAEIPARELREKMLAGLPPQLRQEMLAEMEQPLSWPDSTLESLPPDMREALRSGDQVGYMVEHWAVANCLDDEERVPLLDFRRLVVHESGRRLVIRDGIQEGSGQARYTALLGNQGGGLNL